MFGYLFEVFTSCGSYDALVFGLSLSDSFSFLSARFCTNNLNFIDVLWHMDPLKPDYTFYF